MLPKKEKRQDDLRSTFRCHVPTRSGRNEEAGNGEVVSGPSRRQDVRVAYFNDLAERWDTSCQDPQAVLDRMRGQAGRLKLRPGQDLLEVGCGTGQLTGWLADQVAPGGTVTAVDFAESMLEQARRKKIRAEFRCLDICRDEVGTRCFDIVLCFHSFPHFEEPPAALSNMARSLRAGGRLIVMHLASRAKINAFHSDIGGAVGKDHLPADTLWHVMLGEVDLTIQDQIDDEDLFFLEAVPQSRLRPT